MNREQMKKNVGYRVQLVPIACRLEEGGRELPPLNDDWIINEVSNAGVRISNTRTGHETTLGEDHIHHFTSDPDRSRTGIQHGFLTLNVQIFLQGRDLRVLPNGRPGEPVRPLLRDVVEKWVDLKYPDDCGLQQKLSSDGYRVAWCLDTNLSRKLDLEGWEVVVEPDAQGVPTKFRLRDRPADQTLIKKRSG